MTVARQPYFSKAARAPTERAAWVWLGEAWMDTVLPVAGRRVYALSCGEAGAVSASGRHSCTGGQMMENSGVNSQTGAIP